MVVVVLQFASHVAVFGGSHSSPQFIMVSPHELTGTQEELHFVFAPVHSPEFFSSHSDGAPQAVSHVFRDGALPEQSTFIELVSASNLYPLF